MKHFPSKYYKYTCHYLLIKKKYKKFASKKYTVSIYKLIERNQYYLIQYYRHRKYRPYFKSCDPHHVPDAIQCCRQFLWQIT